jgi:CheY-like chemotaxis protein
VPQPDGRFGVVCYFRDITAQVKARKIVEESREALRIADRRKDEFLATLAHELRNPLAPLNNMIEVMKWSPNDPAVTEQARAMMERQVTSLTRLVDDLLDVSRITRDKLELRKEVCDLAAIMRQAVETCRSLADEMGHQISIAMPTHPVWLEADPVRLAQVFANLLNNACKYTPSGGQISVRAELVGRRVIVRVQDTGYGIPEHMLGRIFELFAQADQPHERAQGGLGIGLTLVKRLVEMHKGTIEARSGGKGRGSEFVVDLPAGALMESRPSNGDAVALAHGNRLTVLVVDDNVDSAQSLAMLLEMAGHETHCAHDGLEAVKAAAALDPDVVFLDIGMPFLNGHEACRRIRALPGGSGMRMIALTGWGQAHDRELSRDAGFDAHLVKPVSLPDLAATLQV